MGEMADYMDDGYGEGSEGFPDAYDFLGLSDDGLRALTARSRDKTIRGIRDWPSPLSDRQRYRLALWASDHQHGL